MYEENRQLSTNEFSDACYSAAMPNAGLTLAVALAAGVLAQSLSRQAHLPGIVLLLVFGAFFGPEFLAWIEPSSLGEGLFAIVDFGIAIILFEGGLNLEWSRLKRQEAAIRGLITTGAVVTLVGADAVGRPCPWVAVGSRPAFRKLGHRDRSNRRDASSSGYAFAASTPDDSRGRRRLHRPGWRTYGCRVASDRPNPGP